MRFSWPLLTLLAIACSDETSAPPTCFAAGGSCIFGSASCSNPATEDCALDGLPAPGEVITFNWRRDKARRLEA